ncbi:MAG: 1-deoxy-D-xylulose-5-phosphate synthase [Armatimonadetes bacterium]|nr:1-deoxy-D-xylulose-5-phosphate synthase [Armatimonadota bacterium]
MLEKITKPADLKGLSAEQLNNLAAEIREEIINGVAKTGGHLASNLGVVELATALYASYDLPKDIVIWDVGHQCYPHKLLTGRYQNFKTLRQFGGISGFPKRSESPYDFFGTGHASTSISAALGFAKARDLKGTKEHVVAVIGDGALTGGLAWEALNNAGQLKTSLTIVLNDNEMSISKSVGAFATHLSKLRMLPLYRKMEHRAKEVIESLPVGGKTISRTAEGILHGVTHLIGAQAGIIFEELGFTYLGPIDGHDIGLLLDVFYHVKQIDGPVIVHVLTTKGKGYEHAENNARMFHGIAPFQVKDGKVEQTPRSLTYTEVFANALVDLAEKDERIVAVTAAMPDGTGLSKFAEKFPERFYDVGIAEQHAVTFAAGLAAAGLRPIVAVYSTFLQRAYDQIVHDVCLQKLPVVFAIDRAGLVGDDGPTHHGAFDLSYLRHIPNLVLAAPADVAELWDMLALAFSYDVPFAIRYPRGSAIDITGYRSSEPSVSMGMAELLAKGDDVCIIAIGPIVASALRARDILQESGVSAAVVNARFVKPLDSKLILSLVSQCRRLVLVEENTVQGGFGGAVLELLAASGMGGVNVRQIGLPDEFAAHGATSMLYELYGLDAEHIAAVALELATSKSSGLEIKEIRG